MPFDGYNNISKTTVPAGYYSQVDCYRMPKSDDYIPYGPQDYTNTVVNLLKVLAHKTFEMQHMYLSTRTFYFAQPQNLAPYLDILQQRASSLQRITILLSRHLKDDQPWIDAFAYLPPNLISVAFKLQVFVEMSNRVNVFKKRLTTLDILNKRVIQTAPTAVILIYNCYESKHYSPAERAMIEAVMSDYERLLG